MSEHTPPLVVGHTNNTSNTSSSMSSLSPSFGSSEDEQFLQLSYFLTKYQSYYDCLSTEEEGEGADTSLSSSLLFGPITPDDLRQVFAYRKLQEQEQQAEQDHLFFDFHHEINEDNNNDDDDDDLTNPFSDQLSKHRAVMQQNYGSSSSSMARIQQLHILLQCFEIWNTKALAQHVLLSHYHDLQSPTDATCWSMLLSLPSSSYAAPLWLMVHKDHDDDNNNNNKNHKNANVNDTNHHHQQQQTTKDSMSRFAKLWDHTYNRQMTTTHGSSGDSPRNSNSNNNNTTSHHYPCGLAIPPNLYTWQEYYRLAHMVAQLPTAEARRACHRSPFCGGGNERVNRVTTQVKCPLHPADLVALWVRAQRNTQARRHLVQLFQVNAATSAAADDDNGNGDTPVFTATFVGNHRSTRKRISESRLIDELTHWAVVNQVLCTHHAIVQHLKEPLRRSRKRRRRCQKEPVRSPLMQSVHEKAKVTPTNNNDSDVTTSLSTEQEMALFFACQRFILRWFAKRHRAHLSALFFSNAQEAIKAAQQGWPVDEQTQKLLALGICDSIRDILEAVPMDNPDRTIPRIDRRIFFRKYCKNVQFRPDALDHFQEIVLTLLHAFHQATGAMGEPTGHFDDLIVDFNHLYERFVQQHTEMGLVAAARAFLDPSADVATVDLANVLLSFSAPWIERCTVCHKSPFKEESSSGFLVCACCDAAVHKECIPEGYRETYNSKSFIQSFSPLKQVFTVQIPSAVPVPDFRSNKEMKWETKIVTLTRETTAHGGLQVLGLELKATESCADSLDKILTGSMDASELQSLESTNYPVGVSFSGSLVTDIYDTPNACSGRKAIQLGDVIVGVELFDFANETDELKHRCSSPKKFSELENGERLALLQQPARTIKLTVKRPSKNIVDATLAWIVMLRECNSHLAGAQKATEHLWFCQACRVTGLGETTQTVKREASFCKAVIRNLADYEDIFSHRYENEGPNADEVVSLRRLDCMMDWICLSKSRANEDLEADCSPFFFNRRRVGWAQKEMESSPFTLLCCGIHLLISRYRDRGKENRQVVRQNSSECRDEVMLTSFLCKFCSWCLAASNISSLPSTVGPPPFARHSFFPSTVKFCQSCCVRALEDPEMNNFCRSCVEAADESGDLPTRVDGVIKTFERCASLVGNVVLCLPEDPLVKTVQEKLEKINVALEHFFRPVEFLIVSYLPLDTRSEHGTLSLRQGVFHLLPIISHHQLSYVLGRCKLRSPGGSKLSSNDLKVWKHDGILDLEGVATLNYEELLGRLEDTSRIFDAIKVVVAKQAQCTCPDTLENFQSQSNKPTASNFQPGGGPTGSTSHHLLCTSNDCATTEMPALTAVSLIDDMTSCRSPIILQILEHASSNSALPVQESVQLPRSDEQLTRPLITFDVVSSPTKGAVYPKFAAPRQVGEGLCNLLYSDIVFFNTEAMEQFSRTTVLAKPFSPACGDPELTVILNIDLDASAHQPSISFWGLDLVQWRNEDVTRVGRVMASSPAARAGLKSGDIVKSVNGAHLSSFRDNSVLACAILSISPLSVKQGMSQLGIVQCVACKEIERKSSGPLVLRVTRPSGNSRTQEISVRNQGIHTSAARENAEKEVVDLTDVPDSHQEMPRPNSVAIFTYEQIRNECATLMQKAALEIGPNAVGISKQHLHREGPSRTVLSLAEASVLIAAILQGHPMLGVRMLTPRYHVVLIFHQIRVLCMSHLRFVPVLGKRLWQILTIYDYIRTQLEPAGSPIVFVDRNSQLKYSFPVEVFPIDALIGAVFDATEGGATLSDFKAGDNHQIYLQFTTLSPIALERVRGGGSPGSGFGKPIFLGSLESWERPKTFVHGKCRTTLAGGTHGTAEFVGYVEESITPGDEKTIVSVFYVSNVGVLERTISMKLSPQRLCLVTEVMKEKLDIIAEFGATYTIEECKDGQVRLCFAAVSKEASSRLAHAAAQEGDASRLTGESTINEHVDAHTVFMESTPAFIDAIFSGEIHETKLGDLPDGRTLYFFPCDPKGLYIASSKYNLKRSLALASTDGAHRCVWGCTVHTETGRASMAFESNRDLVDHLQQYHSFAQATNVFQTDGFFRVPEGDCIASLSCGIAAAATALSPALLCLTKKCGSSTIKAAAGANFSLSPCADLVCFDWEIDDSRILQLLESESVCNAEAVRLVAIGRSIGKLFDSKGLSIVDLSRPVSPHTASFVQQLHEARETCAVCNLKSEKIIQSDDDRYVGLGCAPLTSLCFGWKEEIHEGLSEPKKMLLTLAQKLPEALYRAENSPVVKDPVATHLWKNKNIDAWQEFVVGCSSWRSLVQAFAVLVGSIDRTKLPKWWGNEGGGWSQVQAVMAIDSLSGLMMQLYSFDAALVDFCSYALTDVSTLPSQAILPKELNALSSFDERVELIYQWAKKCRIDVFTGEEEETNDAEEAWCCVCSDGGDLVCCDFCSNVQHIACVQPEPLKETPERFVCQSCMVDIAALYKSTVLGKKM